MYSFCVLAFKICKKCFYDPKNICLLKSQYEYQETQNFMLVSNFLIPAFKNTHKKCYAKKTRKTHRNENTQNLHSFAKKNLRHFLKVAPRNLKSAKILRFLLHILIFLGKICILSYFSQDSNCKHLRRSS